MAFSGITATEAEIDQKSGADVSASFTDTMKTASLLQHENFLNIETTKNWSDAYAGLNVDVKYLVTQYTASGVAMDAISYDPGAIGRSTAELRLNVLSEQMRIALKTLLEKSKQAWAVAIT